MTDPTLGPFAQDLAQRTTTSLGKLGTVLGNVDTHLGNERTALADRIKANQEQRKALLEELKDFLKKYEGAPAEFESTEFLIQALLRWIHLFKSSAGDVTQEEEAEYERLLVDLAQCDHRVLSLIIPALEHHQKQLLLIMNANFPNVSYEDPEAVFQAVLQVAGTAGKAVYRTVENQSQIIIRLECECVAKRKDIQEVREEIQNTLKEVHTLTEERTPLRDRLHTAMEAQSRLAAGPSPDAPTKKATRKTALDANRAYQEFNEAIGLLASLLEEEAKIRDKLNQFNHTADTTLRPPLGDPDASGKLKQYIAVREGLDKDIETQEVREEDNLKRIAIALADLGAKFDEASLIHLAKSIEILNQELSDLLHQRNGVEIELEKAEKLLSREVDLWTANGPKIRQHALALFNLYPTLHSHAFQADVSELETFKDHLTQFQSALSYKNPTDALGQLSQCYEIARQLYTCIQEAMDPTFKAELEKIELNPFLRSLQATALPTPGK